VIVPEEELGSMAEPSSPGLVSGTSTLVGCGAYGSTCGFQKLDPAVALLLSTDDEGLTSAG